MSAFRKTLIKSDASILVLTSVGTQAVVSMDQWYAQHGKAFAMRTRPELFKDDIEIDNSSNKRQGKNARR